MPSDEAAGVTDLGHGWEVREAPEGPLDAGAIPHPTLALVEAPGRRIAIEDPEDRAAHPERAHRLDCCDEEHRPDPTAALFGGDVDRVDLTGGPVALGPDLPFDESDGPARSFGNQGPAIGRALAEAPFPVLDALGERQACRLVGREPGTVGGNPAVVVKLGG